MIWGWWGGLFTVGLLVGFLGAWSSGGARVFVKTLAIPLILGFTRLAMPNTAPVKNSMGYLFVDFAIMAVAALLGDYALGLKLGRHDRTGHRGDSVGH